MESLYFLDNEWREFKALIEGEDFDVTMIKDTLEGMQGEFRKKAENIAKITKMFDGCINTLDAEIKRMNELKEMYIKRSEGLKSALKDSMIMREDTDFSEGTFKFKVSNNGGKLPLKWTREMKAEELPKAFRKVETKVSVDNEAIRKALDDGKKLDYVAYGERGKHLTIK